MLVVDVDDLPRLRREAVDHGVDGGRDTVCCGQSVAELRGGGVCGTVGAVRELDSSAFALGGFALPQDLGDGEPSVFIVRREVWSSAFGSDEFVEGQ